jgi:hypothetical protein
MASFEAELRTLTKDFAAALIDAVKRTVLEDVARAIAEVEEHDAAKAPARTEPPARRRAAPVDSSAPATTRILEYVKSHPGERSENVRSALGLSRADMQTAVRKLLAERKIESEGERRATRYRPL